MYELEYSESLAWTRGTEKTNITSVSFAGELLFQWTIDSIQLSLLYTRQQGDVM